MWPAIAGVATAAAVVYEVIEDLAKKVAPKKPLPAHPPTKQGPRGPVMTGDADST